MEMIVCWFLSEQLLLIAVLSPTTYKLHCMNSILTVELYSCCKILFILLTLQKATNGLDLEGVDN